MRVRITSWPILDHGKVRDGSPQHVAPSPICEQLAELQFAVLTHQRIRRICCSRTLYNGSDARGSRALPPPGGASVSLTDASLRTRTRAGRRTSRASPFESSVGEPALVGRESDHATEAINASRGVQH